MEVLRWLLFLLVVTITILQTWSLNVNTFGEKKVKAPASLVRFNSGKIHDQTEPANTSKFSSYIPVFLIAKSTSWSGQFPTMSNVI
jgi:hypothetical protein